MAGSAEGNARGSEEIREELAESARKLERLTDLDPAMRTGMTTLLLELDEMIRAGGTKEEVEHVSRLSEELRKLIEEVRDHETVLGRSREVLEHAAAQAETDAPVLTNVARRLIDVLAEIGI
jgi:DNA repair ATPase RecN